MDTSTTNEIADGVKYNQEERAGAGQAYLLLRDYLKLAEGAEYYLKSPFKANSKDLEKPSCQIDYARIPLHMDSNTDYLIHHVKCSMYVYKSVLSCVLINIINTMICK